MIAVLAIIAILNLGAVVAAWWGLGRYSIFTVGSGLLLVFIADLILAAALL